MVIVVSGCLNVQGQSSSCYKPRIAQGDALFAQQRWVEAAKQYDTALMCPEAKNFQNGREAKQKRDACKPSLLLDGKDKIEFHCGPEAGSKSLKVSFSKLAGWYVCGDKTNCTVDSKTGTITYTWPANNTFEDRKLSFHIRGKDGVESCSAYFYLFQAGCPDTTIVLKPGEKYDTMIKGDNGIIFVVLRGKCGYIDSVGNEITPLKYDYEEGDSRYGGDSYDEKYGYRKRLPQYTRLMRVKRKGKYGYIDKKGNELTPIEYDECIGSYLKYGNPATIVKKDGKWGMIKESGKEVVPCIYNSYGGIFYKNHDTPVAFEKNGKFAFFDRKGNRLTDFIYEDANSDFWGDYDYAIVKKNGKYGFVDSQGNEVIPPSYDSVKNFWGNRAAIVKNGKVGFIDQYGNTIIPCIYDDVFEDYHVSRYYVMVVCKNGKCGLIDMNGHKITDFEYEKAPMGKGGNGIFINDCYYGCFFYEYKDGIEYYLSLAGDLYPSKDAVLSDEENIMKKAASMGNPYAVMEYVKILRKRKEYSESLSILEKAVQSGMDDALYPLGIQYYYGQGCIRNYNKAYECFSRKINHSGGTLYYLGWMLEHGQGIMQDKTMAVSMYKRAAQKGNENAIERLITLGEYE